ncbi:unnamed protein product [Choristocarpus tenellus]
MNEDASEQYDRQIRLWGLDAQQRMSGSRVLISGLNGVTAEACKNLILAGINATLQDSELVKPEDVGANFFLTDEDVGKNRAEVCLPRAKELNRLSSVENEIRPLSELKDDFFLPFRAVVMSGGFPKDYRRMAALCRLKGIAFYMVETFGYDGFLFCDLGPRHTCRREVGQGLSDPIDMEFPSLEEATAAKWGSLKDRWGHVPQAYITIQIIFQFMDKFGRRPTPTDIEPFTSLAEAALELNEMPQDFLGRSTKAGAVGEGAGGPRSCSTLKAMCSSAGVELSPVCAILGGILGQEVIKAISAKGVPACNSLIFTGLTNEAKVFHSPSLQKK